jgi:radical SAM superfamily enzyme YgiQ (UPF0313 family)
MTRALLVYPEFSPYGFWNYRDVCHLVGAKYPAAPLGLITVAALLPQTWDIKLVDMNTGPLHDADIDWADIVFVGGMLPQQVNFLKLIDRVHARGKRVVAGGPDPSSQPEVYSKADYLVLGEAEDTIIPFLADFEKGIPAGVYNPGPNRPDVDKSPIPRYDLLDFSHYLMIGVQFSRGCPFNCEFCDIIELYGRIPRTKTPEQIVTELDTLYRLGYRGHVDFVDDNFIGHKPRAKAILSVVREWSEKNGHPFYFSTEASINLADGDELLDLMEAADLRYVFVGIESPDEEILKSMQKRQNTNRKLQDDLQRIYDRGIVVNAGFIVGFDNETRPVARSIVETVYEGKVCMAMIGLLYALPNTQLTRRLKAEGRLFADQAMIDEGSVSAIDQTSSGLNFVTKRPRAEIIEDLIFVLKKVYHARSYFDRCLRMGTVLNRKGKYRPTWAKRMISLKAFAKIIVLLGFRPSTAYLFWRNIAVMAVRRPGALEEVVNMMAMYIHFHKQTEYVIELLSSSESQAEPVPAGKCQEVAVDSLAG